MIELERKCDEKTALTNTHLHGFIVAKYVWYNAFEEKSILTHTHESSEKQQQNDLEIYGKYYGLVRVHV